MTPEERQLLSGLFDRIRSTGSNQQRDGEAESFISDAVRQQPYAPYLLSQTVIVQEQALKAAGERLQELEAKVQKLEGGQQAGGSSEGFLGGIGRSLFGGGSAQQRQPSPGAGSQGQYGQGQGGYGQGQPQYGQGQPPYGQPQQYNQPQGGPWGGAPQAAGGGGGFLKGALGMAAGVAGGALLGNAISGLFHGSNNPFGMASGMGGLGGMPGGETVINNYYEGDGAGNDGGFDQASDNGGFDNAADYDDGGSFDTGGGDDSYNV